MRGGPPFWGARVCDPEKHAYPSGRIGESPQSYPFSESFASSAAGIILANSMGQRASFSALATAAKSA